MCYSYWQNKIARSFSSALSATVNDQENLDWATEYGRYNERFIR